MKGFSASKCDVVYWIFYAFLYFNLLEINVMFESYSNLWFCQDFVSMEKKGMNEEFQSLEVQAQAHCT